MDKQINTLVEAIVADYRTWSERSRIANNFGYDLDEKVAEFADEIKVQTGKKYIKVITGNSVWGFVMANDDAKFKKGDILKAASWKAPARNKPRGNVFEEYSIAWTGPHYL